jgi:hypothetical protein
MAEGGSAADGGSMAGGGGIPTIAASSVHFTRKLPLFRK